MKRAASFGVLLLALAAQVAAQGVADNTLRVWDGATGERLRTIR